MTSAAEEIAERYRQEDAARAACDSANRLAAMLGDPFMQGSAATLATLVHKVPVSIVRDELYGWMQVSGLTPTHTRELCVQCLPSRAPSKGKKRGIAAPRCQPTVEVAAERCTNILCHSRRKDAR